MPWIISSIYDEKVSKKGIQISLLARVSALILGQKIGERGGLDFFLLSSSCWVEIFFCFEKG